MPSKSLLRSTNDIEDTGAGPSAAPPVWSMDLVNLGKLALVMHSTLIDYPIGYLQSQDPRGYPGLLI